MKCDKSFIKIARPRVNEILGRSLRLIKKYSVQLYDYAGKVDRSKGYWNPKRKLGVTTYQR